MSGALPAHIRLSTGAPILPVDHAGFRRYGRVLPPAGFTAIGRWLEEHTAIPESGNRYEASLPGLEALPECGWVALEVFGGLDAQAGFCNGHSSCLNALEWHQSPEVNCAATPLVLFLAAQTDLEDGGMDAARAQAFYLPQGTAVALWPGTLHFAPCAVSPAGYRCLVMLPRGTNTPLPDGMAGQTPPLKAVNKWMICHPDRTDLAAAGTPASIRGENTEVLVEAECPNSTVAINPAL